MSNLYIGVMSGTSLDGVDVALCEIDAHSCQLIHSAEYPLPLALKERILNAIKEPLSIETFGELDHDLGELFAESILTFLTMFSLDAKKINAIGVHGQTLWHAPRSKTPFSMQLGDANIIVAKTSISTVADFRRMDVANGGEGAPFAPAFHQFLFSASKERIAVINIGGMANITLLQEPLLGWDSGCGNVLLDYWIGKTQGEAYDKEGNFAKSALLNEALLKRMLEDPYFHKIPPKSTGREYFNGSWLENILQDFAPLSEAEIQRTLLELTARTLSDALDKHSLSKLIICGGGSKNSFLMQRLQDLSGLKTIQAEESDALESMAFAWLAYKRIKCETVDLRSVTGAKKVSLLGAIYA